MNRKTRKLNFIRMKNKIRKGERFYLHSKISGDVYHDDAARTDIENDMTSYLEKKWSKIFKLPMKLVGVVRYGFKNDDVVRNLVTVEHNLQYSR